MKRIGIGGVVAAAMMLAALSAAGGAAASGGPEYLACAKLKKVGGKYTGKWADKFCSQASLTGEGAYERVPAKFPIKTKSKFGLSTVYLYDPIENKLKSEIPCQKGSLSGSITNSREQTITLGYSGCVIPEEFENGEKAQFEGPCNSPGQKAGVLVSKPLVTKLVWLDAAETVPGFLVMPVEPGGAFEEALCSLGKVKIKQTGAILARMEPVGEITKRVEVQFIADALNGEPEYNTYWENGVPTEVKLLSEIKAPEFGIEYPAVPTSENSSIVQKSTKVLVN